MSLTRPITRALTRPLTRRLDAPGAGPLADATYFLDFENTRALTPVIGSVAPTFARNSVGTYFDSAGVMQTASANVARFDHDPVTGASLGLLIEEARTNLLLNSAALATQNVTVSAVAYTLSFYGTGTVTLSGTSTGAVAGAGAFPARKTHTFTPTAGTLTLTVTGSVTFAQLEAGAFATSYIPTAGATVQRVADACTLATSNLPSFSATQGTVFVSVISPQRNVVAECFWQLDDGTSSNRNLSYRDSNSDAVIGSTISAGVQTGALTPGNVTNTAPFKTAYAFSADNFAGSLDGGAIAADTTGAYPAVALTTLRIGDTTSARSLNGHIRQLAYYPTRLANAVLQEITR